MPTPLEQVAQVESALRHRFFTLVPKIINQDRVGWLEAQHDLDRLSRALAAYALVAATGIDDSLAAASITDGGNDGGIDALFFARPNRLLIVQAKFKPKGAAPSQDEVLKTINGLRALLDRRFEGLNEHFQNRLAEIEEALDSPGVTIELILPFLGEHTNQHATDDLNRLADELNQFTTRFCWRPLLLSQTVASLIAEETPSTVTATLTLENWASITSPRKAVYGLVSASSLAALVEAKGKDLFERNIRRYLGSIGVNTAIVETVRRKPADFFYLNNGITAVAERIVGSNGNNKQSVFTFENVSIVNGAQTAGAISSASISGPIADEAKLLITIIEIGATKDDLGLRITRARNHQNTVRGVDFAALAPNQERLRRELAAAGITYHYRPSAEARMRREDAFNLEEAAVAVACLSHPVLSSQQVQEARQRRSRLNNAVDFIITAKKEVGRLWEQDGQLYNTLFDKELTGLRLCRLVRIYRFVDRIMAATETSESTYHRRMFYRHGRFFLMAFVAHQCEPVLRKIDMGLSADDETVLSRAINRIAELIIAESQPLLSYKGFLSIFSNLTDAQPLADGVLRRLAAPVSEAQAPSAGPLDPIPEVAIPPPLPSLSLP